MNRGRVNCNCEEQIITRPEKPEKPQKPEKPEYRCIPHHETETILKCGTSVGSGPLCCNNIGVDAVGINGGIFHPIVQATVALDTSHLIEPAIKIDFSSLISYRTYGDDNYFLRLAFKLSKVCCGSCIPLGTWTFEQVHNDEITVAQANGEYVQETDAFSFSWCGCDDCPDCCRYIVEIVDQQCYNIEYAIVTNISLNAMAVGLKKPHRD